MVEELNQGDNLKKAFDLLKMGDTKKALEVYDEVLDQNPSNFDALINKSLTLIQARRFKESLKCLESISHDSPYGFDKMLIEATCFYSLNKREKAQELYTKISNVIPPDSAAIVQIGSKCLEQSFFRTSIEIFSKLDDKKSKFEKNYLLGLSYKGLGELTNSIRSFGVALRAKPDFYQLYPITAATCFQNNMLDEGDKIMNILKDEHNALFQHVAAVVSFYRIDSTKESQSINP